MLIDIHLVLIPLLLTVAAIFAAAEASLFTLQRAQLESLRETRPNTYRHIRRLLYEPETLLSTLIVGNECLSIMIATFVVALLEANTSLSPGALGTVSVLVSSGLLLTCSEVLPKVLAFRLPVLVASVLVYPMVAASVVLTPFRKLLMVLSERILRLVGVTPAPPPVVNEKDFLTLVEVGAESGSLDREEKERIINVFHFSDLTVAAVMTPWRNVFALTDALSDDDVLTEVRKRPFSRIPVVNHRDGGVAGILYTKELLKLLLNPADGKSWFQEAVAPPYVVSSHKKIAALFREFKMKKVHIALVVDEYGRQIGVVTLEDVLNSLFQTQRRREGAVAG